MTVLKKIQNELEEIYQVSCDFSVDDFLLSPKQVFQPSQQEVLFIKEAGETFEVGLYIEHSILGALHQNSPWTKLNQKNLEAYCTAIEGVSHFLFAISRASRGRPVSQLEMELQAEIDKYILCMVTLEKQKKTVAKRCLKQILFESFHLLEDLGADEKIRYHLANRLAFQYCGTLEKISHPLKRPQLIREIRRFQRKGLQEKIHWLTNKDSRFNLR